MTSSSLPSSSSSSSGSHHPEKSTQPSNDMLHQQNQKPHHRHDEELQADASYLMESTFSDYPSALLNHHRRHHLGNDDNDDDDQKGLQELHQAQLLRVEVDELIQESQLELTLPYQPSHSARQVKWASFARRFVTEIEQGIQSIDLTSIQAKEQDNLRLPKDTSKQQSPTPSLSTSIYNLQMKPCVGGTNLAMLTRHANAMVLPTLEYMIVIPNSMFQPKDVRNGRYFEKRNRIVHLVSQQLLVSDNPSRKLVTWRLDHGDSKCPMLLVYPSTKNIQSRTKHMTTSSNKKRSRDDDDDNDDEAYFDDNHINNVAASPSAASPRHRQPSTTVSSKMTDSEGYAKFRVALYFCMESTTWMSTPLRLLPDRCNWSSSGSSNSQDDQKQKQHDTHNSSSCKTDPTPHYNQVMAWEACLVATHAQFTNNHIKFVRQDGREDVVDDDDDDDGENDDGHVHHRNQDNMLEMVQIHKALILLQVWSLQRGLLRGHDTWTPTTMALMVLYLLRTRHIHGRMSPLQMVAVVWQFIRDTSWLTNMDTESQQPLPSQPPNTATIDDTNYHPRAALVMPLWGKTVAQTIASSSMSRSYEQQHNQSLLDCFRHYTSGPILLDPTMTVNYLHRLSTSFVREWQYQAHCSLQLLHHGRSGGVPRNIASQSLSNTTLPQPSLTSSTISGSTTSPALTLFTKTNRFWTRYDLFCYISPWKALQPRQGYLPPSLPMQTPARCSPPQREDGKWALTSISNYHLLEKDMGSYQALLYRLDVMLRLALGDRIRTMRAWTTGNGQIRPLSKCKNKDYGNPKTAMEDEEALLLDSDEVATHHVALTTQCRHKQDRTKRSSPATKKYRCDTVMEDDTVPIIMTQQEQQGQERIVFGFTLNTDTCHRLVDRGPPADNIVASQQFLQLWGPKAQLRRFQDGAIVYAVVWNQDNDNNYQGADFDTDDYIGSLANDDRMQGGIVQRIIRHILSLHFTTESSTCMSANDQTSNRSNKDDVVHVGFALSQLLSVVDGIRSSPSMSSPENTAMNNRSSELLCDPIFAHRQIIDAFEELSSFLRLHSMPTIPISGTLDVKKSRLGLPLAIDAVEPLSPGLRYSELFPPLPHPALGNNACAVSWFCDDGQRNAFEVQRQQQLPGTIAYDPILIQIRFTQSSKWPNDLEAIKAAKTAMLIQLANGIDDMVAKQSELCAGFPLKKKTSAVLVTPTYLDIPFRGYVFRIIVRADPELNLLQKLRNPSQEATIILQSLTKMHVVSAMHHTSIHAVHTMHPSASAVVRLIQRWLAAHMLSGLIPMSAIELLVAKVYTDDNGQEAPTTATSGFIRFLYLFSNHDWGRQPLIVDPHGHLSKADCDAIKYQFTKSRGPKFELGPPMFIISPNDRNGLEALYSTRNYEPNTTTIWVPTFTREAPEWVVLSRATMLAARTYTFLLKAIETGQMKKWPSLFLESALSFKSYDVLLRVDTDFVSDTVASSTAADLAARPNCDNLMETSFTRSLRSRYLGPKVLWRKAYRNLQRKDDDALLVWRPIDNLVNALREKLPMAVVFYNDLSPQIIAILWRPTCYFSHPFTVMTSENVRPREHGKWKTNSLVVANIRDILREVSQLATNFVTAIKITERES